MTVKSLAVVLAAALLASCSSRDEPAKPAQAANDSAATATAPAAEAAAETPASTGTETMPLQKIDLAPGTGAEIAKGQTALVHYTGYERPAETIPLSDTLLRRVGHMLGTADIVAQMADRCYLEKCRDRLYPEFVLGGLAARKLPSGRTQVLFSSGDDLVRKTPGFYQTASKRLEMDLGAAYSFAEGHFGGTNPYMEAVRQNIRFIERSETGQIQLRRQPPAHDVRH